MSHTKEDIMFQGIAGLDGSNQQPWGAVITIGETVSYTHLTLPTKRIV